MLIWELMASLELTTRQVYEYKTFRLKIDNDCSLPAPIHFTSHGRGNLSGSAESLKICHLLEPEADVQVWFLPKGRSADWVQAQPTVSLEWSL